MKATLTRKRYTAHVDIWTSLTSGKSLRCSRSVGGEWKKDVWPVYSLWRSEIYPDLIVLLNVLLNPGAGRRSGDPIDPVVPSSSPTMLIYLCDLSLLIFSVRCCEVSSSSITTFEDTDSSFHSLESCVSSAKMTCGRTKRNRGSRTSEKCFACRREPRPLNRSRFCCRS